MGREQEKARHRQVRKAQRVRQTQGVQTGLIAAIVIVACVFAYFLTRGGRKPPKDVAQTPPPAAPAANPTPTTAPSPSAPSTTPGRPRTREELDADLLDPRPPGPAEPEPPRPSEPDPVKPPEPEPVKPPEPSTPPPSDPPPAEPPGDEGAEATEPPTETPPPEEGDATQTEKPPKAKEPDGPPPGFGEGKNWPKPTPRHVVSLDHGVAIVPPPDWRSIPPPKEYRGDFQFQEAATVVYSFKDKRDTDPDNYDISMKLWIVPEASNVEDAFARWAKSEQYQPGAVKLQPLKVGPWEARHAIFAVDRSRTVIETDPPPEPAFSKDVTVIFEGGRAGVVEFTCGVRYGKKKADMFLKSAKSFLFLSHDLVGKLKEKSDGGTELPTGWKAFVTMHYEVQYNCDAPFAEEVGRHLELILKEYARRFPMPGVLEEMKGEGKTRRFTVKVFKTYEEFDTYGRQNGVGGAAAYFSPMQDELVCYRTTEEGKKKTFHIIYHEASHQYMHVYFGYDVDIPIWVDEGVAEYFYGGELQPNGSFRIEENKERMPVIKEAIRTNASVSVEDIFKYTQAQYYSNAHICYAEGWSLAYFFWQTKDKKYQGRLEKFYESLKASGDKDKAHQDAFGDLDVKTLEEDWRKFVLGL